MAGRGPRMMTCYICGQQYGKNSLDIHIKSCKKVFLAREAKKPAHERRSLPEAPAKIKAAPGMTAEERIEAANAAAYAAANKLLAPCPTCGRTFNPDRLAIHQRSCRPGNSARPVGAKSISGGAGAPNHPAVMAKGGHFKDEGRKNHIHDSHPERARSPEQPRRRSHTARRPSAKRHAHAHGNGHGHGHATTTTVALASGGSPSSTGVLPLAHTTHPGEAMMPPEVRGVVGERPGTAESSSYGYGYTATRRLSGPPRKLSTPDAVVIGDTEYAPLPDGVPIAAEPGNLPALHHVSPPQQRARRASGSSGHGHSGGGVIIGEDKSHLIHALEQKIGAFEKAMALMASEVRSMKDIIQRLK